jgi:hypothetical protein
MNLIAIAMAVVSLVGGGYFAYVSTTSERTIPVEWDAAIGTSVVSPLTASNLWDSTSTNSLAKPNWIPNGSLATASQKTLTENWIRSIVGTPGAAGTAPTDIKSILVRRVNGSVAELPIMDVFRKIFDDDILTFRRAKDYTDVLRVDADLGSVIRRGSGVRINQGNESLAITNATAGGNNVIAQLEGGQIWTLV